MGRLTRNCPTTIQFTWIYHIIVVTTPLISSDILEYCRTPTYSHLSSACGHLVIITATLFWPGETAIHFHIINPR